MKKLSETWRQQKTTNSVKRYDQSSVNNEANISSNTKNIGRKRLGRLPVSRTFHETKDSVTNGNNDSTQNGQSTSVARKAYIGSAPYSGADVSFSSSFSVDLDTDLLSVLDQMEADYDSKSSGQTKTLRKPSVVKEVSKNLSISHQQSSKEKLHATNVLKDTALSLRHGQARIFEVETTKRSPTSRKTCSSITGSSLGATSCCNYTAIKTAVLEEKENKDLNQSTCSPRHSRTKARRRNGCETTSSHDISWSSPQGKSTPQDSPVHKTRPRTRQNERIGVSDKNLDRRKLHPISSKYRYKTSSANKSIHTGKEKVEDVKATWLLKNFNNQEEDVMKKENFFDSLFENSDGPLSPTSPVVAESNDQDAVQQQQTSSDHLVRTEQNSSKSHCVQVLSGSTGSHAVVQEKRSLASEKPVSAECHNCTVEKVSDIKSVCADSLKTSQIVTQHDRVPDGNADLKMSADGEQILQAGNLNAGDLEPDQLSLSSWGLPEPVLKQYHSRGIKQMFTWQAECLLLGNVLKGGNLVYSAPTSAGKTMVAELLVLKRVMETRKKAIIILPFVSVTREKMFYLQELYQDAGIRVSGFMGHYAPAGGFSSVDVAVCTIEKGNSLINRLLEENKLDQLGVIVVDELHLIGDPHRGYLLELMLTKVFYMGIKSSQSRSAEDLAMSNTVQIIGMSATLPNLDLLAHWLRANLYRTGYRPVPLSECVKIGKAIYDDSMTHIRSVDTTFSVKGDEDHIVPLCIETVREGHSILIFCPTKNWCEKLSETVAREFYNLLKNPSVATTDKGFLKTQDQLVLPLDQSALRDVVEQLRRTPVSLDAVLGRSVPFGVAYHHAGLTFDERDIVEGSFRQGIVKVLIATSTLSSGVNLPARRVVIRTPIFHGQLIDFLTYKQMIGRAGRKGVDSEGESILVCKPNERAKAAMLVKGSLPPVHSTLIRHGGEELSSSLKRAILEVVVSGVATAPDDVAAYTSCTLLAASLPADSEQTRDLIKACISFLQENEFVCCQKMAVDGSCKERFVPTQLGSAVLASSLSPDEGLVVFSELQKARQCFVLENELHIIYLVTPIYAIGIGDSIDWYQFFCLWEQLPAGMKRVAELVGVQESFLAKAVRGRLPTKTVAQYKAVSIHKRFYTALVLHDLVHEMPLTDVARKYNCNKGQLQSLQQSSATFAGMVTVFCARLGWSNLELILAQFQSRLTFGVQRELCDLVRMSTLNGQRARVLYNSGYQTVAALASAEIVDIEAVLKNSAPFQSNKKQEAETEWEAEQRRKTRCIWLTGRKGVTEYEAAITIIEEAKEMIQEELGGLGIQWKTNATKSDQPRDMNDAAVLDSPDIGNNISIKKVRRRTKLVGGRKSTSPRTTVVSPASRPAITSPLSRLRSPENRPLVSCVISPTARTRQQGKTTVCSEGRLDDGPSKTMKEDSNKLHRTMPGDAKEHRESSGANIKLKKMPTSDPVVENKELAVDKFLEDSRRNKLSVDSDVNKAKHFEKHSDIKPSDPTDSTVIQRNSITAFVEGTSSSDSTKDHASVASTSTTAVSKDRGVCVPDSPLNETSNNKPARRPATSSKENAVVTKEKEKKVYDKVSTVKHDHCNSTGHGISNFRKILSKEGDHSDVVSHFKSVSRHSESVQSENKVDNTDHPDRETTQMKNGVTSPATEVRVTETKSKKKNVSFAVGTNQIQEEPVETAADDFSCGSSIFDIPSPVYFKEPESVVSLYEKTKTTKFLEEGSKVTETGLNLDKNNRIENKQGTEEDIFGEFSDSFVYDTQTVGMLSGGKVQVQSASGDLQTTKSDKQQEHAADGNVDLQLGGNIVTPYASPDNATGGNQMQKMPEVGQNKTDRPAKNPDEAQHSESLFSPDVDASRPDNFLESSKGSPDDRSLSVVGSDEELDALEVNYHGNSGDVSMDLIAASDYERVGYGDESGFDFDASCNTSFNDLHILQQNEQRNAVTVFPERKENVLLGKFTSQHHSEYTGLQEDLAIANAMGDSFSCSLMDAAELGMNKNRPESIDSREQNIENTDVHVPASKRKDSRKNEIVKNTCTSFLPAGENKLGENLGDSLTLSMIEKVLTMDSDSHPGCLNDKVKKPEIPKSGSCRLIIKNTLEVKINKSETEKTDNKELSSDNQKKDENLGPISNKQPFLSPSTLSILDAMYCSFDSPQWKPAPKKSQGTPRSKTQKADQAVVKKSVCFKETSDMLSAEGPPVSCGVLTRRKRKSFESDNSEDLVLDEFVKHQRTTESHNEIYNGRAPVENGSKHSTNINGGLSTNLNTKKQTVKLQINSASHSACKIGNVVNDCFPAEEGCDMDSSKNLSTSSDCLPPTPPGEVTCDSPATGAKQTPKRASAIGKLPSATFSPRLQKCFNDLKPPVSARQKADIKDHTPRNIVEKCDIRSGRKEDFCYGKNTNNYCGNDKNDGKSGKVSDTETKRVCGDVAIQSCESTKSVQNYEKCDKQKSVMKSDHSKSGICDSDLVTLETVANGNHGDVGLDGSNDGDENSGEDKLSPSFLDPNDIEVSATQASFTIIDVCADKRLFKTFIMEWRTKARYTVALACEKRPQQPAEPGTGIGGNFKKGECQAKQITIATDVDGIELPGSDLVIVGLAVCWENRDAYYIAFSQESAECDPDDSLSAPPCDPDISLFIRLKAVRSVLKQGMCDNTAISITMIDMKTQYRALVEGLGVAPLGQLLDPKIACWMLDPGAREKNLHRMVTNLLPTEVHMLEGIGGGIGVGSLGMSPQNPCSGRYRATTECVLVHHLMAYFQACLNKEGLYDVFRDVEMPVAVTLCRMELNGFGFSLEESESQKSVMLAKLSALEEQAYSLAGHGFCLSATEDIAQVLFIELQLPPNGDPTSGPAGRALPNRKPVGPRRARQKCGLSTSKDVLEKLKKFHPLPGIILEWRRITNALTKVVFPLQKGKEYSARADMYRMFCEVQLHSATGRISLSEPNLQNIPKDFEITMPDLIGESPPANQVGPVSRRTRGGNSRLNQMMGPRQVAMVTENNTGPKFAVSMRHAFVPFEGGVLLAADYSQLELRMIAYLSGDDILMKILNAEGDVFKMIAGQWKCIPPEEVTATQRAQAKQVCYGMIYGIGAKALGEQLEVDENDAGAFIETFKAKYPGMRSYLRKTVDSCREKKYVQTMTGRKRYLEAIISNNPHARAQAERQAVNTTVQGSAADLVKRAMIRIDERLMKTFPECITTHKHKPDMKKKLRTAGGPTPRGAYLVLQLHDELIYEVNKQDMMQVAKIVKEEMECAADLPVKFPVKIKVGPTWGKLEDFQI